MNQLNLQELTRRASLDPEIFAAAFSGRHLRSYQRQVLGALVGSIRARAGRSFVVIFARQSGKNELQAQLFAYLLAVLRGEALNMISVSPTYKPQTLNAIQRLETVLARNPLTRRQWRRREGFQIQLGQARVIFRTPNWEDYVEVACSEIRACGANNLQVARRMRAMLENLMQTLPEHRRPALAQELRLLDRAIESHFNDPEERARARVPDLQGLGGASGARLSRLD